MPTNDVEQMLSDTADFAEGKLREHGLEEEVRALCNSNSQTPYVCRLLKQPDGCELLIVIRQCGQETTL